MRVHELMTRHVDSVRPYDTVRAAAALMRDGAVGALAVVDEAGRAIGLVTDRDLAVRVIADGLDPLQAPVRLAMTPQVFSCGADDEVAVAASILAARRVRRLLVVDERERPVGMLSIDDLARVVRDAGLLGALAETVAAEGP